MRAAARAARAAAAATRAGAVAAAGSDFQGGQVRGQLPGQLLARPGMLQHRQDAPGVSETPRKGRMMSDPAHPTSPLGDELTEPPGQ